MLPPVFLIILLLRLPPLLLSDYLPFTQLGPPFPATFTPSEPLTSYPTYLYTIAPSTDAFMSVSISPCYGLLFDVRVKYCDFGGVTHIPASHCTSPNSTQQKWLDPETGTPDWNAKEFVRESIDAVSWLEGAELEIQSGVLCGWGDGRQATSAAYACGIRVKGNNDDQNDAAGLVQRVYLWDIGVATSPSQVRVDVESTDEHGTGLVRVDVVGQGADRNVTLSVGVGGSTLWASVDPLSICGSFEPFPIPSKTPPTMVETMGLRCTSWRPILPGGKDPVVESVLYAVHVPELSTQSSTTAAGDPMPFWAANMASSCGLEQAAVRRDSRLWYDTPHRIGVWSLPSFSSSESSSPNSNIIRLAVEAKIILKGGGGMKKTPLSFVYNPIDVDLSELASVLSLPLSNRNWAVGVVLKDTGLGLIVGLLGVGLLSCAGMGLCEGVRWCVWDRCGIGAMVERLREGRGVGDDESYRVMVDEEEEEEEEEGE